VLARVHFQINTVIGVVLLIFTVLGVALSWRDRWVRVYTCLAVVALAYSFGSFSAFHGWVYALSTGLVKDLEVTADGPESLERLA